MQFNIKTIEDKNMKTMNINLQHGRYKLRIRKTVQHNKRGDVFMLLDDLLVIRYLLIKIFINCM